VKYDREYSAWRADGMVQDVSMLYESHLAALLTWMDLFSFLFQSCGEYCVDGMGTGESKVGGK